MIVNEFNAPRKASLCISFSKGLILLGIDAEKRRGRYFINAVVYVSLVQHCMGGGELFGERTVAQ